MSSYFTLEFERREGVDSAVLLSDAMARVRAAGWRVGNVDVVVVTEGPRIAPHRQAMRERLAGMLGVGLEAVNVKGKSVEGLGALAGGAGVAVQVVCLLVEEVDRG